MNLKKYENQQPCVNISLFKDDEYSFFVLGKIVEGVCALTLTDDERIIICYSNAPHPVWVWLPDDATEGELEEAYAAVKDSFGFDKGYTFNMKYSHACFFMERVKADGGKLDIELNLFAYNCAHPVPPKRTAEGECRLAKAEEAEIAAQLMWHFHRELDKWDFDMEYCLNKAKELIGLGRLYFWCDRDGEIAAMATYRVSGDKGSIGNVYTLPSKRRHGYAASLVYQVTLDVESLGKMPVLYTDADYSASNACYEGIGYVRQGELCTIG